jgi:hypothetical protein
VPSPEEEGIISIGGIYTTGGIMKEVWMVYKDINVCKIPEKDLQFIDYKKICEKVNDDLERLQKHHHSGSRTILNDNGADIKYDDIILIDLESGMYSIVNLEDNNG